MRSNQTTEWKKLVISRAKSPEALPLCGVLFCVKWQRVYNQINRNPSNVPIWKHSKIVKIAKTRRSPMAPTINDNATDERRILHPNPATFVRDFMLHLTTNEAIL